MRVSHGPRRVLKNAASSRREFLKSAAVVGLASGVGSQLFIRKAVAAPKRGGTLRAALAHGAVTDGFDPTAMTGNGFEVTLNYVTQGFLTLIGPSGKLEGDVAESWESAAEASVWTFKIRKGLEFHNGKTVEADDVIASVNLHRGKDTKSGAAPIVSQVVDIKADGPQTVVFTLEAGNADFPFLLSDYHLCIRPASDGKIDPNSGVSCGAYVVESYQPGVKATLTRFEKHYNTSNGGFFDRVELYSIVDPTARVNALLAGDVQVIDRVDLRTAGLLARQSNLVIEEKTGYEHYLFVMRCDTDPYKSVDVRLALKYGIDRQEMLEKILGGHGFVAADHPISPANLYYAADIEPFPYDPERAKFHLKKAGLDTLSVQLSAADTAFAGAVDAALLYQERAKPAGIDIQVLREPNDGYFSNVWMKKPWCATYWGGRPTEDWMFSSAYQSTAAWNETFWKNEQFDQLLLAARKETNPATRKQQYHDMQLIVRDDGGAVIPFFTNHVWARSNGVAHADEVASNWSLDGFRFIERWWFA